MPERNGREHTDEAGGARGNTADQQKPGEGLILTSETQYTPLSVKVAEALIRAYLL